MTEQILLHLKRKGLEVYFPGQKQGLCERSYSVVKDNGQYAMGDTNKVGYSTINIIVFCPLSKYSQIGKYKKIIKGHMKELENLTPTGYESPVLIEDKVKAYTMHIEYKILKRL